MEHQNNVVLTETPSSPPRKRRLLFRSSFWAFLLLLALIIAQWVERYRQVSAIQEDVARRLSVDDQTSKEARLLAKQAADTILTVQAKVALLEERLAEIQNQSIALQAMYQEMSSGRDQRLLAEVEQAITLAVQQLQFAGNVETAVIALENADTLLAKALQPELISLRRLLERDITRLKALPGADLTGLSLKIESVVTAASVLPLAFEHRPESKPVATVTDTAHPSLSQRRYWQAWVSDVWHELSQLVRIERIEARDPALLSPSQSFFLRENLKLRLLNARLALLQRDGKTFRNEILQAQALLDRYFDVRASSVVTARKTLTTLATTEVDIDLPSLDETLTAVRNLKLSRDRGVVNR